MNENTVLGNNANFHASTLEQVVESSIPLAVEQSLDFWDGFVPCLFELGLTYMLGHEHISSVQLAIADDLNNGDVADFLADRHGDADR